MNDDEDERCRSTRKLPNWPNKLSPEGENHLDQWLMDLWLPLQPTLWGAGFTPNGLTTLSMLFQFLAVWCLHCGAGGLVFAVLWVVGYAFDVADGQMARLYCEETEFGDWYDHVTDVLAFLALIIVCMHRYRSPLFGALLVLLFSLAMMHLGCQQRQLPDDDQHRRSQDGILDRLRWTCPCRRAIRWTRFFGTGTVCLILVSVVVVLEHVTIGERKRTEQQQRSTTR